MLPDEATELSEALRNDGAHRPDAGGAPALRNELAAFLAGILDRPT